jgi:hypothetical protein
LPTSATRRRRRYRSADRARHILNYRRAEPMVTRYHRKIAFIPHSGLLNTSQNSITSIGQSGHIRRSHRIAPPQHPAATARAGMLFLCGDAACRADHPAAEMAAAAAAAATLAEAGSDERTYTSYRTSVIWRMKDRPMSGATPIDLEVPSLRRFNSRHIQTKTDGRQQLACSAVHFETTARRYAVNRLKIRFCESFRSIRRSVERSPRQMTNQSPLLSCDGD